MKKRLHLFKVAGVAILCAVGFYVTAFVIRFDIFSAPVRSSEGWLGPRVRGDLQAVDAGKIWHTDAPNVSSYRAFGPLRELWLRLHGLSIDA